MLHLTYFGCPECGEEQSDWLEPESDARTNCIGRWHDGDRYACICGRTFRTPFHRWLHRIWQGPLR